jgi:uncharacterized protein (DUF3084 family)
MKADLEILDAGLAAAEKLYLSLRTFKQIVGEIVSLDDEAKRARAEAAEAQRHLSELQAQVTVAQTQLDKLQAQREQTEKRVQSLADEHNSLTAALNAIKSKFKDAA